MGDHWFDQVVPARSTGERGMSRLPQATLDPLLYDIRERGALTHLMIPRSRLPDVRSGSESVIPGHLQHFRYSTESRSPDPTWAGQERAIRRHRASSFDHRVGAGEDK
jgi:hypothetical protein